MRVTLSSVHCLLCLTLWSQDTTVRSAGEAQQGRSSGRPSAADSSLRPRRIPTNAGDEIRTPVQAAAGTQGTNVIRTVAGTTWLFSGNLQSAINAPFGFSEYGLLDSNNNLIFSDRQNHMVFRIGTDGIVHVVAGNGLPGFSGDGGPALQAQLNQPGGIALDSKGNLYIVDAGNLRIRRVDANGVITTIAGDGYVGSSGDNGPAKFASFNFGLSSGIAVDANGAVYVYDTFNARIRMITPDGNVTTIAGNGTLGYSGDNGPALQASFNATGLLIDSKGNILVTDTYNHRIRKILTDGTVVTVAGTGTPGTAAEGASAASAPLNFPFGLFLAPDGAMYFCDNSNNRVLRWATDGTLHNVAGGVQGYSGDGGPALSAALYLPRWVVAVPSGSIYVGDHGNWRIRLVANGTISTFAGNGKYEFTADGSPASSGFFAFPWGLAIDNSGNLLVADADNNVVKKIDRSGNMSIAAGTRRKAFGSASGGLATSTSLSSPRDLAVDASSNVYLLDNGNQRVLKIGTDGHITTVAGTGSSGFSGDNGSAKNATFNYPLGLAVDSKGNLYIADTFNHRIRKIAPDGTISTLAGTGTPSLSGDGGPATLARLNHPDGVSVDSAGNVYVADSWNDCVRKITPDGLISRFAGSGVRGFSADGGPAVSASLHNPIRAIAAANGTVYISDGDNNRVRAVTADGIISTLAGDGQPSSSGDFGNALLASLNSPLGIAVDASGAVYIGENEGNRIRAVAPGTIDLQVSPITLNFSAQSNGAITQPASIATSSSTPGLPFTAAATTDTGGNWLNVNATTGLVPSTVSVTADPTGLAPGTYSGVVSISAAPVVRAISVTFTVADVDHPKLSVNSNPLSFTFIAGTPSSSLRIQVANAGTGGLTFSATVSGSNSSWLSVAPAGGTATPNAPVAVTVTANPGVLGAGTYAAAVSISSSTTGESATVPVTMTISNPVRILLLSQTGLTFRAVAGGGKPLPQTVSVLNIGMGTMDWTAEASTLAGGNWLGISKSSGTVVRPYLDVSPFDVTVDASGLTPADYYGSIQVRGSNSPNSPQTISIVLTVLPYGTDPGPEVRPTGLVFTGVSGASPGSQSFSMAQIGASPTNFNSSRLTLDGVPWFVHAPTSGMIAPGQPGTVVVQPNFSQLGPGVLYGNVQVIFGSFTQRTVSILTVVAPAGSSIAGNGDVIPEEPNAIRAVGCSVSSLLVQPTLLNDASSSVTVGQPASLQASAADNCGKLLTSGTLAATFSNGDAQVKLVHVGNGNWSGTWTPRNASQSRVVIQMVAFAVQGVQVLSGAANVTVSMQTASSAPLTRGAANAASGVGTFISPGGLVSIYGQQLADQPAQPSATPFPTELNGTQVLMGGKALPLRYVGANQVNAQVPFELTPDTQQQLIVRRGTTWSVPQDVVVAAAQPAVYTQDQLGILGSGVGVIVNGSTNALITPANPAKAGDTVVLYCNGLGAVTTGGPLAYTVNPLTVTIGGIKATVNFAGLAPGYPDLYQVNAVVPSGVQSGRAVQVVLSIAGQTSPPVTMAVQ